MLLSQSDLFAIVAVVDIAIHGQKRPVKARDIGPRHGLSKRYFDSILQGLSRGGILDGKRGTTGGYRLARAPNLVTAGQVVRALRATQDMAAGRFRSSIARRIVIPTLKPAHMAFSRALQSITIEDFIRSAASRMIPEEVERGPGGQAASSEYSGSDVPNVHPMDDETVMHFLRAEVKQAGGQAEWARTNRVSRVVLNRVLNGHDQMPASILKSLKLRTAYLHDTELFSRDRDILLLLRSEIKAAGGQAAWAKRKGKDRSTLNKLLNGHRPIPPSIREALNLRTVYFREGVSNEMAAGLAPQGEVGPANGR
jgi:Rrf2 family protein